MSGRELLVLGTASQVPTRTRAHHAAFLRFDGYGFLLDPGEGAQRQMTLAGLPVSAITDVFVSHAHGDHCLGLPGVLQRLSLDGVRHRVDVRFPYAAETFVRRLRYAASYDNHADVQLHPVEPGVVLQRPDLRVVARPLAHVLPTLGWRFEEPDGRTLDPKRLTARGIMGPDRSTLVREGRIRVGGRTTTIEEVSHPKPGQRVAVVLDTGWCDAALELAEGADLLLVEATFLESERAIAEEAGHLTARQAALLAREAGVRRTVLTHFSRRYADASGHLAEVRATAPELDIVVGEELTWYQVPARLPVP